jgi:hypothetical protein
MHITENALFSHRNPPATRDLSYHVEFSSWLTSSMRLWLMALSALGRLGPMGTDPTETSRRAKRPVLNIFGVEKKQRVRGARFV